MTLLNPFSRRRCARTSDAPRDGTAALIFYLLLGLVFAPVIGLHVALAASDMGVVRSRGIAMHDSSAPASQHRSSMLASD